MAFGEVGIELEFTGEGLEEVATVKACNGEFQLPIGKEVMSIDPRYFRPTEVELLIGDPTKSREKLDWEPKYDLIGLVKEMMEEDVKLFKKDLYLKEGGHDILNFEE